MTALPSIRVLDRQKLPAAFEQVCALGKKYRKTLGFFPRGAFEDHADQGNIIIHLDPAGDVDGYVAFRLTGNPQYAHIVHLCVAEAARGQGIAKALVDQLSQKTRHMRGIQLYCRPEYEANKVWRKLDFMPIGHKRGRGADAAALTVWWKENGQATLFSMADEVEYLQNPRVRVLLDANIIFDFDDQREYHAEASGLLADWLTPLVAYNVSPEIQLEVFRQPDLEVREKSKKRYEPLLGPPASSDDIRVKADALRAHLGWGSDENTVSDSKHLAYAHLQGYRYFITRDDNMLSDSADIKTELDVIALRPSDFVMSFDQIQREDYYRPVRVGDTKFHVRPLRETDSDMLYEVFRNHLNSEAKKDFHRRLNNRLALPDQHENLLYETQDAKPLLLLSTAATSDAICVEFFRTRQAPMIDVLARFVLNRVIMEAFRTGKAAVTCNDTDLSDHAREALAGARFHQVGREWVKLTPRLIGEAVDVAQGLRQLEFRQGHLQEEASKLAFSIEAALERPEEYLPQIEEVLWPAKILHEEIGNFILPIKPTWARKLFDEDVSGLFGGYEKLLLNWQNVYYSAAKRQQLLKPGSHILWYVSTEQGYNVRAIRACSTVEEVRVGSPRELHEQFKHLGVYRLRDLNQLMYGKKGEFRDLLAIRFSRMELFQRPVSFAEFEHNRQALGLSRNTLPGPVRISDEEFMSLYLKGHGEA